MNPPFAILLAAAFFGASAGARAEPFTFAPADGDHYLETSHREVIVDVDVKPAARDEDVTDTTTDVTVRKTGDSIRMDRTVKSMVETDNGKPFGNPAAPLALNRTTTNVFDLNGTLLRVDGNENLIRDAERIFPVRFHAALEAQFAPGALETGERLVWQLIDRGILLGHEIRLNERWASEQPAFLRNQPINLSVVSRVVGLQRGGKSCDATVLTFASTDPALLKGVDRPGIALVSDPAVEDFLTWNIADLPLEKVVSRVTVDAKTLHLIQREKIIVDVDSIPAGIKTRTEHETICCKPLPSD